MNISHCFKTLSAFLSALITLCATQSAQAKDDESVFDKRFSKTQKILVIRHELEGIEKEKAQQEHRDWAKSLPTNYTSSMPDHFYIYTFRLSSTDGKKKENLWQMKKVDFDDAPSKLTFFDVFYEASIKKLVLVYKSHASTVGEVVNTKTDASHREVPPLLLQDDQGDGVNIMSAALSGSLSKGDLFVLATNNIGDRYSFLWKMNQWTFINFQASPDSTNPKFMERNLPLRETGKGF